MFTGIIKSRGKIYKLRKIKNGVIIKIYSNIKINSNEIGSSISCSGVCLTLTEFKKKLLTFYVSKETLYRSNLSTLKKNDTVNLEKSLKYGERISGHFVQGHVDATSKIDKIKTIGKSWYINFKILKKYRNFIVQKGSITINGVSLTVSNILKNGYQVVIIPHTLKLTNLILLKKDDTVNVEFDILGKYIKAFLK